MCPIYKTTREEAASPKAKANILRALVSGKVHDKVLYEAAFQYVIDRCVNCGSCFLECPSNVHIPQMAIEARSRYAKRFGVSLANRLLVSAEAAGRYTRKLAPVIRVLMAPQLLRSVNQRLTGIAAQRPFVSFAPRSLFERIQPVEGQGAPRVLYFSGCYAGYIRPEIGQAAVKVLERLGMAVMTPVQHCCGLPMLSKGMVDQAKRKVTQNLARWRHLLDSVDHVVVTCSSCGLSLMQEWRCLTGDDALNLLEAKMIHISQLVLNRCDGLCIDSANLKLAYHHPCHLKIQPHPDASVRMLQQIDGVAVSVLDSHCCGMAGTWGFSAGNFSLSARIGSDLVRKLHDTDATFGVTDCPTCRMQMEHLSRIPVRHPIEVLASCLD
jgi:Fe-S oxidoreductase